MGDKSDKEVKKKDCLQEKGKKIKNKGKLILDATCAPADIKYPTDLGILNQARIETERIIDNLYKPLRVKLRKKPRTSRKIARKEYLKVAKKRKVSYQERRKAIGKQLKYLKEKLGTSDRETIEQIRENPYLQYFIGLNCYQQEPPLESSMLVHFRKRIDGELINKINKKIVK